MDFGKNLNDYCFQNEDVIPSTSSQIVPFYSTQNFQDYSKDGSTRALHGNVNGGHAVESHSVPWDTQFFQSSGNTQQQFEPGCASTPVFKNVTKPHVWNPAIDSVSDNGFVTRYPSKWTGGAGSINYNPFTSLYYKIFYCYSY